MSAWKRLREVLFDFSAEQRDGLRQVEILTDALDRSTGEDDFPDCYRRATGLANPLKREEAWAWLMRRLADYRHARELMPQPRTLAQRHLADLRRQLGLPPDGEVAYPDGGAEVWPPAPKRPEGEVSE